MGWGVWSNLVSVKKYPYPPVINSEWSLNTDEDVTVSTED